LSFTTSAKESVAPFVAEMQRVVAQRYPDLATNGEFLAAIEALREGGVDELAFYNWGHLRRANLAWIGDAMRGTS